MSGNVRRFERPDTPDGDILIAHHAATGILPTAEGIFAVDIAEGVKTLYDGLGGIGGIDLVGLILHIGIGVNRQDLACGNRTGPLIKDFMGGNFGGLIAPDAVDGNILFTHHAAIGIGPAVEGIFAVDISIGIGIGDDRSCLVSGIDGIGLIFYIGIGIGGQGCGIRYIARPSIGHFVCGNGEGLVAPFTINGHIGVAHHTAVGILPTAEGPTVGNVSEAVFGFNHRLLGVGGIDLVIGTGDIKSIVGGDGLPLRNIARPRIEHPMGMMGGNGGLIGNRSVNIYLVDAGDRRKVGMGGAVCRLGIQCGLIGYR